MAMYTSAPGQAVSSPQKKGSGAKPVVDDYDDARLTDIYNEGRRLKALKLSAEQERQSVTDRLAAEQSELQFLADEYEKKAQLAGMSAEDRAMAIAAAESEAKEAAEYRNHLGKELSVKRKAAKSAKAKYDALPDGDPDAGRLMQELAAAEEAESEAKKAYTQASADDAAKKARLSELTAFDSEREDAVTAAMDEIRGSSETRADIEDRAAKVCDEIANDDDMEYPSYSENNMKLVYDRNPDARRVAGKAFWEKHGYRVSDGAEGIEVIAPQMDEGGNPVLDGDGKQTFVKTKVYDISETDAYSKAFEKLLRQQAESMVTSRGSDEIEELKRQISEKQRSVQELAARQGELESKIEAVGADFTAYCREHAGELTEYKRRRQDPPKAQRKQEPMENQSKDIDIKDAVKTAADKEQQQTFREKFRNSQFMAGLSATGRGLAQMLYFDKIAYAAKSAAKSVSDKIARMRTAVAGFKESAKEKVAGFKGHFAEKYAKKAAERDLASGEADAKAERIRDYYERRKQRQADTRSLSGKSFYQMMDKTLDLYQSVIDNPDMSESAKNRMVSRIARSIQPAVRKASRMPYAAYDDDPIVAEGQVKRGKETYAQQFDSDTQGADYEMSQPEAAPQGV